jgi:N-acetylmuramoyl-L-alanine amidase-like
MREYRALFGPVAVVLLFLAAVLWSPFEPHRDPVDVISPINGVVPVGAPVDRTAPASAPVDRAAPASTPADSAAAASAPAPADVASPEPEDTRAPSVAAESGSWADEDWAVFEGSVRWALEERLDTLPLGQAMVALGRSFVGTAYVPGTLELEGPERLVINFRGLDCVTFVENTFALAQFVNITGTAFNADADLILADRSGVEDRYEYLLAGLRYRDGEVGEYPSRLHYFTDWIADNARRGLVADVTAELGGVTDDERVDFMTTHTSSYPQLANPDYVARVRGAEQRLSAQGRTFVPEDMIGDAAQGIRDGDIIAATSTVQGLDVAHTGLALWIDGSLHLLHAPLVGESVQISEVPLADRIARIGGQDGIIVARPSGWGGEN